MLRASATSAAPPAADSSTAAAAPSGCGGGGGGGWGVGEGRQAHERVPSQARVLLGEAAEEAVLRSTAAAPGNGGGTGGAGVGISAGGGVGLLAVTAKVSTLVRPNRPRPRSPTAAARNGILGENALSGESGNSAAQTQPAASLLLVRYNYEVPAQQAATDISVADAAVPESGYGSGGTGGYGSQLAALEVYRPAGVVGARRALQLGMIECMRLHAQRPQPSETVKLPARTEAQTIFTTLMCHHSALSFSGISKSTSDNNGNGIGTSHESGRSGEEHTLRASVEAAAGGQTAALAAQTAGLLFPALTPPPTLEELPRLRWSVAETAQAGGNPSPSQPAEWRARTLGERTLWALSDLLDTGKSDTGDGTASPGLSQLLPDSPRLYGRIPDSPGLSQVLPDSPGLSQLLPDSPGLSQLLPDWVGSDPAHLRALVPELMLAHATAALERGE
ncbi:hypothetical protein T492DRAFT_836531 [Pavlovales sp. CCMP2436]|nr:hypothetical protein T492DRAFT_836531 [Pavlovales sp. CCMP2436]